MKIFKYILVSLLALFVANPVYAAYLKITKGDLRLEKTSSTIKPVYAIPKSILIVPIAQPNYEKTIDPLDWYRGIYYYQTTRFILPSITFHYIITEDGKLIEFDTEDIDRKIEVGNLSLDNPIVIGYMTSSGSTKFAPYAKEQIEQIILDLANKNAIPIDNILVKSLSFIGKDDRSLSLQSRDIFVGWQQDLDSIKAKIKDKYLPIDRSYSVTIKSSTIPTEPQEISSIFEGKIVIKNTGEFPMYKDSGSEILLTKKGGDSSIFFINNVWSSQTQVALMTDEKSVLRPKEEMEFTFKLKAPFGIGKMSDTFEIRTADGVVVSDKQVVFDVNIKKPDGEIVEIADTGAGYLRVRSGAGINFDEVTRVSPGEKFFVLKRDNSWVQIKISEDKSGWVAAQYTKVIK